MNPVYDDNRKPDSGSDEMSGKELDVRIVRLEPMNVAATLGFGESPEGAAIEQMAAYAAACGMEYGSAEHRVFGFNNPNPSEGSPNYGYEVWMVVGPEARPAKNVEIKDFAGGLFAVTRVKGVENIFPGWQKLTAWVEASKYRVRGTLCLEEQVSPPDATLEGLTLDLYEPVEA
jgi:DNA gyrase inhibitor GyrI